MPTLNNLLNTEEQCGKQHIISISTIMWYFVHVEVCAVITVSVTDH